MFGPYSVHITEAVVFRVEKEFGYFFSIEDRTLRIKSSKDCEFHHKNVSPDRHQVHAEDDDFLKCENEAHRPTGAEIRTEPFRGISKEEEEEEGAIKDGLVLNRISEAVGDASDSRLAINRWSRSLPVQLSSVDQSNNSGTDDDATISRTKHCYSTISDPRQPILSNIWPTLIHARNSDYLNRILKDLPAEERSSVDEDSFRSLSTKLCRYLGKTDAQLCRVLGPVCVRSGPAFVRRILDGQEPLESSESFQAIVHLRSDERLISEDSSCNEPKKDIRIFDESMHTLKV